jgi:hypothetical protein
MNNIGQNVQDQHEPVLRHYGIPMTSFRNALWPEIEAGRLAWDAVGGDVVHPNDRGHAYLADFVNAILDRAFATLPPDSALPEIPPLPEPLTTDLFQYATIRSADEIEPVRNNGWEPAEGLFFGTGWKAERRGSELVFEVEAEAISLLFWRIKGKMGMAEAQVDDRPPVRLDGWFDADWGGYMPFQLIARDLGPGKHELRIRLLDERNPGSEGHEFQVHAVMAAGVAE